MATSARRANKVEATPTPTGAQKEESLKDAGNRYFANGNYPIALELFTRAIDAIMLGVGPTPSPDAGQLHILFSNRSATFAAMRNFQLALEDAEQVIHMQPSWPKGYFRKGSALEGLVQFNEAQAAYEAGLAIDPKDPFLVKAAADLKTLLEELKSTQAEMCQSPNPDADRFELMVRWLKQGGARFPRLYLQYYSQDHRGVHCLSNIPSDEIILYVPHHLIMTSGVAMESPIGRKIVDAQIDLRSKHSYLAAYLLQEKAKGKESFWEPYISSLPQFYDNMPIFFKPDLLQMLKGSFTLDKIKDRIDSLRAEYNNICAHVPEFRQFTHDEFVWARLAVITRIFGMNIKGSKTDGLVAYADMLNHKKPRDAADTDTRWNFDDNLNGFTITSMRQINRGEQVYDSYGRKCNSRFFVNYGFALEDNEDDNEAVIRFQLLPDHPGLTVKSRLVPSRNLAAPKEFQIPATYRETSDRERKTKEMFGWLRFVHATDAELLSIGAHEGMKPEDVDPISTRLEMEVLKHVCRAAEESLRAFDTTLEEDDALLKTGTLPMFSNERNCVLQRRGEKQVLNWFVQLAKHCIPLLTLPWVELRKHASKYLSNSARDHFVTHVIAVLVKRTSG